MEYKVYTEKYRVKHSWRRILYLFLSIWYDKNIQIKMQHYMYVLAIRCLRAAPRRYRPKRCKIKNRKFWNFVWMVFLGRLLTKFNSKFDWTNVSFVGHPSSPRWILPLSVNQQRNEAQEDFWNLTPWLPFLDRQCKQFSSPLNPAWYIPSKIFG